MSTHTHTTAHRTSRATASTGTGPGPSGHPVSVTVTASAAQRGSVTASSSGGRGDLPHVAVLVGECLTYAYDPDAVTSHRQAWTDAAQQNHTLRLPMALPAAGRETAPTVVAVVNAHGPQARRVVAEPGPAGQAAITVIVGAVTTRVLTSEALRSHLHAWTRAATLTGIFPTRD